MPTEPIRWGILGTGSIAARFAEGLDDLPDAELVAVGSRSAVAAEEFGTRFSIPRRHACYESLVSDPHVDVVYVATPHSLHKDNALLALAAGRAVLVEKPFAINAAEAGEVMAAARERRLFVMEAMWTRFLPIYARFRELLTEGVIGDVQMLLADFGIQADRAARPRLFDRGLGGGAILDLGVYPVSLASMIFGHPSSVVSMAQLDESGIDERAAIILGYGEGQLATLCVSITAASPTEAHVFGNRGRIKLHRFFNRTTRMTLSRSGHVDSIIELPLRGNGYGYEACEVMRCLRAGKLESDVMRLDETQSVMETLDEIRAQVHVSYPTE